MADADATNPGAAVRLWIRRTSEPHAAYTIRFEVIGGKGILRVGRPGVLVDPPARPTGLEERLTAAQVSTTRFLHVWDGGRYRQAHALTRLTESLIEVLPANCWVGLAFADSVLVLPSTRDGDDADAAEPGRVDDEPTWPRREMLAVLQRELRELEAKEGEHDRTERRSSWNASCAEVVEIPSCVAPPPNPYVSLDAWLSASDPAHDNYEERTILMGGSTLAIDRLDGVQDPWRSALPPLAPVPSPPWEHTDDLVTIEEGEAPDEDEDEFDQVAMHSGAGMLETLEAPPEDEGDHDTYADVTDLGLAPASADLRIERGPLIEPVTVVPLLDHDADDHAPVDEVDAVAVAPKAEFHERNTTLVRFLRRRITLDRARIAALEGRVAELEALLARRAAR